MEVLYTEMWSIGMLETGEAYQGIIYESFKKEALTTEKKVPIEHSTNQVAIDSLLCVVLNMNSVFLLCCSHLSTFSLL
jgi:hypothetical protein